MKRKTKELYLNLPDYVLVIQKDIAFVKIKCAKAMLNKLYETKLEDRNEEHDELENDVVKAIEWNKRLLEEI